MSFGINRGSWRSWNPGKKQVILETPSIIKDAPVEKGQATRVERDKNSRRLVTLGPEQAVILQLELK